MKDGLAAYQLVGEVTTTTVAARAEAAAAAESTTPNESGAN